MTTFSIEEDVSVGTSGVSAGVVEQVKSNLLAAAEIWNRYFIQGSFDIKIELGFSDLDGSTLASGGTGFTFFGGEGPGLEVWQVDSLQEFITGAEDGGNGIDITINVDAPLLASGDFFFDPDPFSRTASVPTGKSDFLTVMLHELGHGFGFLSINPDGMDAVDNTDTSDSGFIDLTPYDLWVDPDAPGGRSFVGPTAKALFGDNILLDPGGASHLADASDGGFENLLDPSLTVGTRSYIAPIHIAILEDIGMPIRKPTNNSDDIYGFEFFDDVIDLRGGNDTFHGLSGNDFVLGGTRGDTLFGDEGADTLDGGGASDSIEGGEGNDLLIGGLGADTAHGEDGNDVLDGGGGQDSLFGQRGADSISGGIHDDRLYGGDGNDTLNGGNRHDDRVSGQNGDDLLFGGAGNDRIYGGLDNDTLNGDGGVDFLNGGDGNDSVSGGVGNDSILGQDGADTLNGDNGEDTLRGGEGADILFGGVNTDTLHGDAGADTLDGGNREDVLYGGSGDDELSGGNGNDTISGNGGDDRFIFRLGDDHDIITDFETGGTQDHFEIIGFGTGFNSFAEVLAASTQVGSDILIDFGTGDFLTIQNADRGDLTANDFVFG